MPTFLAAADAPIPETVEGRSLLPLLADGDAEWRPYYHGEHSPCYHPENANQFLTDQRWKYIWNPVTGEEQLFDLEADPCECRDLSTSEKGELARWRSRMVAELAGREEGLSDGRTLKPGTVPVWRFEPANELHLG